MLMTDFLSLLDCRTRKNDGDAAAWVGASVGEAMPTSPGHALRGFDVGPVHLQQAGPAAVDVLAHLCAALGAERLELAMLELDPRRIRGLGDEANLDLGADRG